MTTRPPIPTPPAHRWRQLRTQLFPIACFGLALLAAATLWTRWVAPPTLVGEAELVRAEVRSAQAGALTLQVSLLQPVKAGETLGLVHVASRDVLAASFAMIRAEIEAMRSTQEPVIGRQRALLDTEQLKLDWMARRVELAALTGELHQAETTFSRSARLHQLRTITDEEFDLARNARDTLAARVRGQTELVASLEPSIKKLDALCAPEADAGLEAAIRHKEQELRLLQAQLSPVPLVAPIDGVITTIMHRTGGVVGAAEPILEISATRSERIVGYLRQPLPLEPVPGMTVAVRTRGQQRAIGTARVAEVGSQLEPISQTLLAAMRLPITATPTEFGLRLHITPPDGLQLRPGEQVDLILQQ